MLYNLSNQEYIEDIINDLYKKFGTTISQYYLIKAIIYKLRYIDKKCFVSEEDLILEFIILQMQLEDKDEMQKLFKELEEILEKDEDDLYANAFLEFLEFSKMDKEIQKIKNFHTKH